MSVLKVTTAVILSLLHVHEVTAMTGTIYSPKRDSSLRVSVSSSDFTPEGIAYDTKSKRILLSQMGATSTAIRSIPYSKSFNPANFTAENQLETIFTNSEYATGVGIAIHPNGDDAWMAMDESFPPTVTSKCAVVRVNLRDTSDVDIVEFTHLRRAGFPCFTNDITFSHDGQYLFVTDFFGYQVFYMDISTPTFTPQLLIDDLSLTCNSDGGQCPTPVESFPYNGPNGIEVMPSGTASTTDDILLFTNGHNRLTRTVMNSAPSSYSFVNVNITGAESIAGLDGMVSNPVVESNLVYSVFAESAYALHSADDWLNARLVAITYMDCPNNMDYTTTAALVENEIAVICNNNFWVSPYDVIAFPLMSGATVASSTYTLTHDLGIGSWSMEYDKRHDRMVVGSTDGKGVVGFPSFGDGNEIDGVLYESLLHTYFMPGTDANDVCKQILYLFKDGECNLWATCTSYQLNSFELPERISGSQGLGLIDMCDTSGSTALQKYIDLTDLLTTNSVLVKHVVYTTGGRTDIFVSDLIDGHVFRVTDVYSSSPTTSLEIDGSVSGIIYTNGLEVYNDILLIGGTISDGSASGLFRYDIATGNGPTYFAGPGISPGSPLINSEGMRFNGDKSLLYWPKYLSEDTDPNEVLVVQSSDGWTSDVSIAMTLQIDCVSSNPRDMSVAVAFSDTNPDNAYNEDLWLVCNNNNGNGPYLYPRIENVNGLVTGLGPDELVITSSSVSASNEDCQEEEDIIYGVGVAAVVLFISTIVFAVLYVRAKKADEMKESLTRQTSAM